MLVRVVVIIALVSSCLGFERDENYYSDGNETIVNLLLKTMELSDYKMPPVDNLGLATKKKLTKAVRDDFQIFQITSSSSVGKY